MKQLKEALIGKKTVQFAEQGSRDDNYLYKK